MIVSGDFNSFSPKNLLKSKILQSTMKSTGEDTHSADERIEIDSYSEPHSIRVPREN